LRPGKQKKEKKCTKAGCAWNAKKEKCSVADAEAVTDGGGSFEADCAKQKKEKKCTKAGCAWDAKKEKCADCAKQKKSKKCKKAGCKWKKSEEKCLAKKK
jgi:hypothetical protein